MEYGPKYNYLELYNIKEIDFIHPCNYYVDEQVVPTLDLSLFKVLVVHFD